MSARQTSFPEQWLITDERIGDLTAAIRKLPRGSGILFRHHALPPGERERLKRRVRRLTARRGLLLVDEGDGQVARVHCAREIRRARASGAAMLLLSPIFPTRTHPAWAPLPNMRAAALARLCGYPLLALGGMNARRFAQVRRLGFDGWAGIDAWSEPRT